MKTGRSEAVRLVPLADCAEVLPGFSVRGRMQHHPAGTHQLLLTKHLRDGVPYSYEDKDDFRIVPGRDATSYELRAGDVLFMSRGTRNLAWAIKDVPDPTIAPVSFYIIRPAQGVDAQYLAWYLNQPAAQAAIDQVRTGAGTPVVQRRAFEQIEILLPPPHEQREVAELAGLLAQENDLRRRLADATQRAQIEIGRQIIEALRARAGAGEKR